MFPFILWLFDYALTLIYSLKIIYSAIIEKFSSRKFNYIPNLRFHVEKFDILPSFVLCLHI